MPEVDELKGRARRAESRGEHRRALEIYRQALRAGRREDDRAVEPALVLRIAELQAVLGRREEARRSLSRYLEAVGGPGGELESPLETVREVLRREPDQELCLRTVRMLERAGRTAEALDLLQTVWEERTGRRQPAGAIEDLARRLDPDVDIGSWTPEWPPVAEDGYELGGGGGDGEVAARPEEGGPRERSGERREEEEASGARVVRRYRRRSRAGGGSEDRFPRRLRSRSGGSSSDGIAGGQEGEEADPSALRRGLRVLEELLELEPDDPELHRRRVEYARRLGESELLEQALTALGDVLLDRGALRAARLVYRAVLDRLDPWNSSAEAGLREVEAAARAAEEARRDQGPGGGSPREAPTPEEAASEVDGAFRRRVSAAFAQMPRELDHLRSAGLASGALAEDAAVPWWAHRELGRYLLLRDRPREAISHLEAAHDRAPPGSEAAADVLYHLGVAHRRARDAEAARDCFRRLAERDPAFAAAWSAVSG